MLETLADRRSSAALVANGTTCEAAITIAAPFDEYVRSVQLVDPDPAGSSG